MTTKRKYCSRKTKLRKERQAAEAAKPGPLRLQSTIDKILSKEDMSCLEKIKPVSQFRRI